MDASTINTQTRFCAGFETQPLEASGVKLPWRGTIPEWLRGSLLRTGPARFEVGKDSYRHWFDGLAMLYRFELAESDVLHSSRFLRSKTLEAAEKAGAIAHDGFASARRRPFWSRRVAAGAGEVMDNGNVNVVAYGAHDFVALTETPNPVRFDPLTLETEGAFRWVDGLASHTSTAHPAYDAGRGLFYNFETVFGRSNLYRFTAVAPGTRTRRLVWETATDQPAWIHSFGMSARYLILAEFPFVLQPLRFLFSTGSFLENLRWRPERALRFTIVDKDTGAIVKRAETDACFGFHLINAFEDHDAVVLDLVAYPDAAVLRDLYLDRLRTGGVTAKGALTRFRIPLGPQPVTRVKLSDAPVEMPRFDDRRRAGLAHRYVYAVGQARHGFMDRITKCDVATRAAAHWSEEGCYPGEPIFVAAPDGRGEDEGAILSVVLDTRRGRSFLLVLDAATLEERARAYAPHTIPFDFHGAYFAHGAAPP
jgi:carotenoid cleavage dioxygenase-like enzyme